MSFVEGLVLIIFIVCVSTIVLSVISRRSHQGKIIVSTDEEGIHYSLEIDGDPYDIQHMKSVTFKIVKDENIAN